MGLFSLGLATILLVAHFWFDFNQWAKITVAIIPLMASWCATAYGVKTSVKSTLWREILGASNGITMGLALGLIGQIYNIPMSMAEFVLVLVLTGLPILWVTRSLSWMIFTGMFVNAALFDSSPVALRLGLLGLSGVMLVVPDRLFKDSMDWVRIGLSWAVAIGFSVVLIWTSEALHPSAFLILPSIVWSILIGTISMPKNGQSIKIPMVGISGVGLFFTLFLGSFSNVWDEWAQIPVSANPTYIAIIGALIGIQLAMYYLIKTHWFRWALILPGIVFIFGMGLHKLVPDWIFPNIVLMELIAGLVGVVTTGVTLHRRWLINCGLFGSVLVMISQFLGSIISLSTRAVLFFLVGAALLALGYRLNRWNWTR